MASLRIENPVKKIALAVLLFSAFAWAAPPPNPADYTINIHVSRTRNTGSQRLDAVIDGRKYELQCYCAQGILALGNYKAKLIRDEHKNLYDSIQVYEFLLPGQKTRTFTVVGVSE
jgi:hypothetical protein